MVILWGWAPRTASVLGGVHDGWREVGMTVCAPEVQDPEDPATPAFSKLFCRLSPKGRELPRLGTLGAVM